MECAVGKSSRRCFKPTGPARSRDFQPMFWQFVPQHIAVRMSALGHFGRARADCWQRRTNVWREGTRPAWPQALLAYKRSCAFFETLMQDLQTTFVIAAFLIAAAAFLAGLLCGERLRAKLARQAWQKRRWRRGEGGVPKTGAAPDPAEQLRLVMRARFEKRRLLSRSEAQVLYAAERAINTAAADLKWRVMAQVSLGEVLSSPRCAGLQRDQQQAHRPPHSLPQWQSDCGH